MNKNDIILYEDSDIVKYMTNIEGWVETESRRYWGTNKDSEHMARYSACTHKRCKCGNIMRKYFTLCKKCREEKRTERYFKREWKKYDSDVPVYSDKYDEYFYDYEDIFDFCGIEGIEPDELNLIICEPNYCHTIDPYDYYIDISPDGVDDYLPDEILDAFDKLNKTITECKTAISWEPGRYRTSISV